MMEELLKKGNKKCAFERLLDTKNKKFAIVQDIKQKLLKEKAKISTIFI